MPSLAHQTGVIRVTQSGGNPTSDIYLRNRARQDLGGANIVARIHLKQQIGPQHPTEKSTGQFSSPTWRRRSKQRTMAPKFLQNPSKSRLRRKAHGSIRIQEGQPGSRERSARSMAARACHLHPQDHGDPESGKPFELLPVTHRVFQPTPAAPLNFEWRIEGTVRATAYRCWMEKRKLHAPLGMPRLSAVPPIVRRLNWPFRHRCSFDGLPQLWRSKHG
jgi:hypothetical protein